MPKHVVLRSPGDDRTMAVPAQLPLNGLKQPTTARSCQSETIPSAFHRPSIVP